MDHTKAHAHLQSCCCSEHTRIQQTPRHVIYHICTRSDGLFCNLPREWFGIFQMFQLLHTCKYISIYRCMYVCIYIYIYIYIVYVLLRCHPYMHHLHPQRLLPWPSAVKNVIYLLCFSFYQHVHISLSHVYCRKWHHHIRICGNGFQGRLLCAFQFMHVYYIHVCVYVCGCDANIIFTPTGTVFLFKNCIP